jgi:hypothetical protein
MMADVGVLIVVLGVRRKMIPTKSEVKGFKLGESRNLQLRADFFNAFKHYNPDPSTISTNITSQTYGRINNGLSGGFATRVIQLAGKFYF